MNSGTAQTRKNFRIDAAYLIAGTLVINLLSLALPLLTLQVYDRIIPNPDSGTLPILITGVIIAVVMEVCLRLARARMIGWNGTCYEHITSCNAIGHLLETDMAMFNGTGTGEHLSRLSAIGRLKDFNSGFVLVTLLELTFLPIFIALIAFIAGPLVFAPLLILALFTASSIWYGHRLKQDLDVRDHADDNRYNFLIEALNGIHTLKSFSLENKFQRHYEKLEDVSTRANFDVTETSARTFNAATIYAHAMTATVIAIGAIHVLGGHMTSGALIASVLLSGRIMQPVQRVLSLWARYQDYGLAKEKVDRIFSLPLTKRKSLEEEPERLGRIELKDVGFRCNEESPFLFRNVSLSVSKGETIRISGAHGSGKTILLNLMAGLYAPGEGAILLDGAPPVDYPAVSRLRHIGLMKTKGIIFRGTIRDNITLFGSVTEAEAREISGLIGIDREVSTLPRGFDTFLEGTETDAIPPGLRQRIAIARVLAAKPRVILFDNADRNLDREGYRQIYQILGKLRDKAALILVTDDNNIGHLASRHYVLSENGLQPAPGVHSDIIYGELRA